MPEHLTAEKKLWGNLVQHCGSAGKESAHNAGELGSISGLGRSPGERKGYCGLENSTDCMSMGSQRSRTGLSNVHVLTLGDL